MPESQLVHDYCTQIGLPISLYTPKRIERRNLPLNRQSFVFGDMDCMHGAMRQLKISIPEAVYYPPSLKQHLHRNVWLDTLTGVRSRIEDGGDPVFAKPATRAKRFTGRVISGHSDFYHIEGTSLREPVWCSEVVNWTTEYRVYVNGAQVVGVDHYDGDPSAELDGSVITAPSAITEHPARPPSLMASTLAC